MHGAAITFLLLISLGLIMSQNFQKDQLFERYQKFMERFNKTYESLDEMSNRFMIFKNNCAKFNITELKNEASEEETIFGMTEFMDMSSEEFENKYLKLNFTDLPKDAKPYFANETKGEAGRFLQQEGIPAAWDWRKQGALSNVKNQGYCGGCWAFSAIGNIESLFFIKYGKVPTLSVQQLIDCDPYNSGCLGGLMHTSYHYIQQFGLMEAKNYQYEYAGGVCRYNANEARYKIAGYVYSGSDNEEDIKAMLYRYGPLAITINGRILQYYSGGIINVPYASCPYAPNHGVLLIGYGTTPRGLDYWIVRNTYGTSWGENGDFRIARGRSLCGLNKYVVSAVLQ
jgi:cathepsin F